MRTPAGATALPRGRGAMMRRGLALSLLLAALAPLLVGASEQASGSFLPLYHTNNDPLAVCNDGSPGARARLHRLRLGCNVRSRQAFHVRRRLLFFARQ